MQFLTLETLVKCPSGLLVLPHISVDALMGDHAFDPPLLAKKQKIINLMFMFCYNINNSLLHYLQQISA